MADNILPDTDHSNKKGVPDRKSGNLKAFIGNLFSYSRPEYVTFSFALEAIDPLACLEMCWNTDEFQYYWEKPSDEFAIAAGGTMINLSARTTNRFQTISKRIQSIRRATAEYTTVRHPYCGMMFLGGFSFFDDISNGMWKPFEAASFTVPEWTIIKDGKFSLATFSVKLSSFDNPSDLHQYLIKKYEDIQDIYQGKDSPSEIPKKTCETVLISSINKNTAYRQWISSVEKATDLIAKNNFEKIVLARKISVPLSTNISATKLLNKLRGKYTNCFNYLIHKGGKTFLGSSPERLGAFRNRLLLTEALAGSMRRGDTATEDTIFERNLTGSSKNRKEHNFVIKDIEERLAPFAKDFYRSKNPEIKKLLNVQHLYTPIRAHLKSDADIFDVIGQLHPTPAVGGYPWKNAAPYINELEDFDRGWYASPVGWLNSKGMGEFAVGIRSGLLTKNKAHFFAGCGIVADSDPAAEWEETNLKLKPMLSALQYD